MAEALKSHFGADVPRRIAGMISGTGFRLDRNRFLDEVLDGYEPLGLMQRGWRIARTLRQHLPADYSAALEVLLASIEPERVAPRAEHHGMSSFLYLPHTLFIAEYGVEHFELSMRAQHRLTQRFTAEFSIRPFLERHPEATLTRLREWTGDPSPHVRRLVSEGTRPRLPWAPRLRAFQSDPRPVLALLELLKDDPELYVRRSVANNLNDIGKDHPDLLADTARAWMVDATDERRWLVRHALRSAVKRVEPEALDLLGFGAPAAVSVRNARIAPAQVPVGGSVVISFELANESSRAQRVLVDCRVHFVKAGGRTGPKVFKIRTVELEPRASTTSSKTISLAEMTTRKHYPGEHRVELLLNGTAEPIGAFELLGA
jgi:3-methyladenine DNA glycosylase AlkC